MIQLLKNSFFLLLIIISVHCQQRVNEDGLPFINKPDFTPEWISKSQKSYADIHTIPAFSFIDQDGNPVTEKTMKDKIYVADFFFTSCGSICPKMTNNMKTVYDHFATNDKIRFLSHTVMPEIDSIKVLNRYASAKGIDSRRWHLLTGNKDEIYHLAKKEYYAGDTLGYYQTGNEFLHTENFILLDQQRRIRGIYNGTLGVEMNRLIEDIETLLKE